MPAPQSMRKGRWLIIVVILLLAGIATVLLIPRGIAPEKQPPTPTTQEQTSIERPFGAQAYAAPAKAAIMDILKAANQYHDQTKTWPTSVDQLEKKGLVVIPDTVKLWWMFSVNGSPIKSVTATSTAAMPDGPLHPLTYRVETNRWMGYSITPYNTPSHSQ